MISSMTAAEQKELQEMHDGLFGPGSQRVRATNQLPEAAQTNQLGQAAQTNQLAQNNRFGQRGGTNGSVAASAGKFAGRARN